MKLLPAIATLFVSSVAIAGPFDRSPDEARSALNQPLEQFGIPDRIEPGSCKSTKLYRGCEFEHGKFLISVTGPMGGGSGTARILIVSEEGASESFANLVGAVMVAYAPALDKADLTAVAEKLLDGANGDQRKGSVTIDGTYFSLLRTAGNRELQFHVMRD